VTLLALLTTTAGAQNAASTSVAAPAATPADALVRRAEDARSAGRLDEAAQLFRQALAARPRSPEALWGLGSIAYERDRHAECRDAFQRLTAQRPAMAAAWALRGLCEFQLGSYGPAREHLDESLRRGLPLQDDLGRVVLYHQALVLVRATGFDLAIAPLRALLQVQPPTPELNVACGLVLLRRPLLPQAVPAADRELVAAAGEAYCASLARHPEQALPRYEALLKRYPRERYLRYGYGLALAQQGSEAAIEQYREEVGLNPDEPVVQVELALALLTRGRDAEALAPAERAVRLAPGLFAAHLAFGRALVGTGELARGLQSLETAAALAPRIPAVQLALARAYAQAGRRADAEQANRRFLELEAAGRAAGASAAAGQKRP
jgi:tetratricopeptide (TPR) repeat protein